MGRGGVLVQHWGPVGLGRLQKDPRRGAEGCKRGSHCRGRFAKVSEGLDVRLPKKKCPRSTKIPNKIPDCFILRRAYSHLESPWW